MSKKIGIVTLYKGSNYGNKLQHYAIVHILRRLGYEPLTVHDETVRGFADPLERPSFFRRLSPSHVRAAFRSRLQYSYHRKNDSDGYLRCVLREWRRHAEFMELEDLRQRRFDEFTSRHIPFGDLRVSATRRPDPEEMARYAAFVCGSDQVWNPTYRDTSPVRFLAFAPRRKRIALAPSFGVAAIPESRREAYRELLDGIPRLSVREDTGREIVKELTGRDAPVLVDPTLMLTPEEWNRIARRPERFPDAPFLLTYFLGNRTASRERTMDGLARQRGLRVVDLFEICEAESYPYDPAEFLWLVAHADFVCTDSFHGTVFSILYRKDFYVFSRSEVGFSGDQGWSI